jgi:formylglycine-generating enzyme required for sulfatase activity
MQKALEENRSVMANGRAGLQEERGTVYRLRIWAYGADSSEAQQTGSTGVTTAIVKPPATELKTIDSLRRQLAEARENLRLIEERKAEYVLVTDIPLQLIKDERRRRARVTELTKQIAVIGTVLVPAGDFWMGSGDYDHEAYDNERPVHRVFLPAYEIGKYPVTNAQYWAFVQDNKRSAPAHWQDGEIPSGKENHPVVNVSLEDARAFCNWLTKTTGQLYRLPTEGEWEKVARGPFPDRRRYPWGGEWLDGAANTQEAGYNDTTPVDAFEQRNKSPFGAVDMAGNVMEWTSSEWKAYPGSTHDSMVVSVCYVVRGGSHTLPCNYARVSQRGRYPPSTARPYLGFRVVLEIG